MIELEFSVPARQWLNRRIPAQDELAKQVIAWADERNQNQVKINWQFTVEKARSTVNCQYVQVNSENLNYKST